MAELTKDQFDELPDFAKAAFTLSGDKYVTVKDAKLKETLDDLDGKYRHVTGELDSLKAGQQAAIERAKAEALEQAKNSGETKEIIKRYDEQMADLQKRFDGQLESERAEKEALAAQIKASKRDALLADVRSKLGIREESAKIFNRYIESMIDIDPVTGKETYLSEDGSATSLDRAGFLSQLESDSAFDHMRKATVPSTGGQAQGNNGTSGGGAPRKFEDLSGAELSELRKVKPQEYERLKADYKSRH